MEEPGDDLTWSASGLSGRGACQVDDWTGGQSEGGGAWTMACLCGLGGRTGWDSGSLTDRR